MTTWLSTSWLGAEPGYVLSFELNNPYSLLRSSLVPGIIINCSQIVQIFTIDTHRPRCPRLHQSLSPFVVGSREKNTGRRYDRDTMHS
jgi:hypothetical protein